MSVIKVTVCQLPDEMRLFERDWEALAAHVQAQGSQLVLLPEMAFAPWFARERQFDSATWRAAVAAHEFWMTRLAELGPVLVLGSRPVEKGAARLNEGFAWDVQNGYRATHTKYYLPDEDRFWEASWYQRGDGVFTPVDFKVGPPPAQRVKIGFSICTELWFMQHGRAYGVQGIHILANPRATERGTCDKWLAGGRAAAVVAGAFCLSSNRCRSGDLPGDMGGMGWIVSPDGEVLGLTSEEKPFVTLEIALEDARKAKLTYPRYVQE